MRLSLLMLIVIATAAKADKVLYVTDAGDTSVVLRVNAVEKIALENDVNSISGWLKGAIQGKISSCKEKMVKEWIPKLQADPEIGAMPSDMDDLILYVSRRSDYKSHAALDSLAVAP